MTGTVYWQDLTYSLGSRWCGDRSHTTETNWSIGSCCTRVDGQPQSEHRNPCCLTGQQCTLAR